MPRGPTNLFRGPILYKYVDLFAGCGGLSLGIERSGGSLQLAVEKSDMAARTFFANFIDDSIRADGWANYVRAPIEVQAQSKVAVTELRHVLDNVPTMGRLVKEGVDVVVGGPPCQGSRSPVGVTATTRAISSRGNTSNLWNGLARK